MSAPSPRAARDYARPLARRTGPRSSAMDLDWLVQAPLSRDVTAALARHATGTLLDVGCGHRPYEPVAPPGVRWIGMDTKASDRSGADAWALAGALPFRDGAFDTVLCTQVLEHVEDPGAAVAEMVRVLRPGGKLIVTVPQAWFLHEEPYDFWRFTRYGLRALLARAGAQLVEERSQGGFFAMAGIFAYVHAGSYLRWLAERRGPPAAPSGRVPAWRRALAPLRLPMAAVNLVLGALDRVPHPRIFALNHLAVAVRPPRTP